MFSYKPTPEEIAAARILKEKGWDVSEPKCPLCHGWGTVGKINQETSNSYSWVTERCPNGCIASEVRWHF